MTSRPDNSEQDWSEIKSRWVEYDRQLRAPDALLDPVFGNINKRGSRPRTAGYIAAAAATLVAAAIWWDTRVPDTGETGVIESTPAQLPAAAQEQGPCAAIQSCVDVNTRLASLSLEVVPDL